MSPQLKLLYLLIVSYSAIGHGRGDSPDSQCGNISLYIHHTNEINVRISLSGSSKEACSRWLPSAEKVSGDAGDGKQSECAVGLFWCLSQFERRCYIYQNRYGSCEGDMISFVAQLDSSQESCKGVHGPPSADCWNGVSIDKDCSGPFNSSVVTPFCIPYPDVPLSPADLTIWIIISVAIAALAIALIIVAVVIVVVIMKSRRRAIVERQGEEDADLLFTPPGSLERDYGSAMTNPTVGTGGAQTGDTFGGNTHQNLLSSRTQSLLSRDYLQLSLNSDQVVGFQE